jgi:hypothetical protein
MPSSFGIVRAGNLPPLPIRTPFETSAIWTGWKPCASVLPFMSVGSSPPFGK